MGWVGKSTLGQCDCMVIYTIGHSNHTWDSFAPLLMEHRIQVVVATRTNPVSRRAPFANRRTLPALLEREGTGYIYMGDTLGGKPNDPTCYDGQGQTRLPQDEGHASRSGRLKGPASVGQGLDDCADVRRGGPVEVPPGTAHRPRAGRERRNAAAYQEGRVGRSRALTVWRRVRRPGASFKVACLFENCGQRSSGGREDWGVGQNKLAWAVLGRSLVYSNPRCS